MKKFLYSLFFIFFFSINLYSIDFPPLGKCSDVFNIVGENIELNRTIYKIGAVGNHLERVVMNDNIYHTSYSITRYEPGPSKNVGCVYKEIETQQVGDTIIRTFVYSYGYNASHTYGYFTIYEEVHVQYYINTNKVYLNNDDELGFFISSSDKEVLKNINDLDANSRKAYACSISGMGGYSGVTLDYLGGALAGVKNKNGISFKNLLLGAKSLSSIISSTPLNNKKAVACAIRCSGGDLKINEGINSSSMCSEKSISDYNSSVNSTPMVELSELSELEKKAIQTTYNNCVINYDTCMLEASKNDESYYNQLSDKDKALIDSLLGEYENSQILIRDDENRVIGAINNGSLVAGTLDENGLFIENKKDIVVTLPNIKDEELVLPNENGGVAVSPDISIPNNKEENDKIQLPSDNTKPNENVNVGEVVKPNELTKPNENVNVGEVVKPNELTKPNENVNVGEVVKPNELTKPNEAVKPDEVVITKPSTEVSINKENSKVNVDVNVKVDDITIKLDDSVEFSDSTLISKEKAAYSLFEETFLSNYNSLYDMFNKFKNETESKINDIKNINLNNVIPKSVDTCPYYYELDFHYFKVNNSYDFCHILSYSKNITYIVFYLIFFYLCLKLSFNLLLRIFR